MPRRSSGLSCRLQVRQRPRRPRASRPVHFRQAACPPSSPSRHLHFSFFSLSPNRSVGAVSQVRESERMVAVLQSPGSRRSVAPYRLSAPPPPQSSPALPRGCNRPRCRASLCPVGRLTPAPVRPQGLPACLRATPDDRFAATGSPLRQKVFSPYPVPADFAALRLPDHGLFRGRLRDLRTLRPSA